MITQKSTDNHCLLKNTLIRLKRERKYIARKIPLQKAKQKLFININ